MEWHVANAGRQRKIEWTKNETCEKPIKKNTLACKIFANSHFFWRQTLRIVIRYFHGVFHLSFAFFFAFVLASFFIRLMRLCLCRHFFASFFFICYVDDFFSYFNIFILLLMNWACTFTCERQRCVLFSLSLSGWLFSIHLLWFLSWIWCAHLRNKTILAGFSRVCSNINKTHHQRHKH